MPNFGKDLSSLRYFQDAEDISFVGAMWEIQKW